MFSSPSAGKSADSLTPLSPGGSKADFPFHSSRNFTRPTSRRGSTTSSIHSVGNPFESNSTTLYEAGQNAISTLLQPPIVRTGLQPHTSISAFSSQKPPTSRDIPPVALTNIAHVEPQEFAPYLKQVNALYQQLQSLKDNEEETTPTRDRRSSRADEQRDGPDAHLRPGLRPTRKSSTNSLSSLNSLEPPSPARRTSSGHVRKAAPGPPPLSTIPTVYFDDDFHLENPRTFDVVSERSEVIPPEKNGDRSDGGGAVASPRKALATNAILQEKLSWYMDTIEVHLINSISTASTTFFTALGSLKELHSEAADSVTRIRALRKELGSLDDEIATSGLQVAQKRQQQQNLERLQAALSQLRQITEGVVDCESLVDKGELDKALAGIDSLEKLLSGEKGTTDTTDDPGREIYDLRSTSALQGISTDLNTLRFRIGKAYESQFADILVADLRRHIESVSYPDVLQRWSNAASRARGGHARSPSVYPTYLTQTEELRKQILPSMQGLHRAQHVSAAALAYREVVLREIKNIIRRPLPSSSDDDNESMMSVSTAGGGKPRSNQEKSSILARNLRALEAEDAEELLKKVYIGVTETLRRLSTQVKVLLDIASSLSRASADGVKSPPVRSPISSPRADRNMGGDFELQEELHKALNIGRLQDQAVDISNEKIVKVLKVRSEQTARLPLQWFLRYFTLNFYFANECEAISGKTSTVLKNVVNNHIREFVQKHGDQKMTVLATGMGSDQWNAKDFTEHDSEILQQILESSDHDAVAWSENTKIWTVLDGSEGQTKTNGNDTESNGVAASSKKETRCATIEDEKFVLPNSAVLLLDGVSSFMQLVAGIPSITTEVASSLIAYLQLFNSRCTQLILGAGATKSAGLKNITTKHLALASQALAFTAALVPHMREFVRRHAGSVAGSSSSSSSSSSVMGEFDKVRRLLQEHQDSIHQKLVEIMSGRAAVHSRSMQNTEWDASEGPHAYMETLTKETTTLHRVLTKHLPETSVQMIMVPVFASYKQQLGDALTGASPHTAAGQASMHSDIKLFTTRLSKLEGFGDTGDFLHGIVQSKHVDVPSEGQKDPGSDGSKGKEAVEDKKDEAESKEQPTAEETPESGEQGETKAEQG